MDIKDIKSVAAPPMSMQDFALLGGHEIAYMREMSAEDAAEFFPAAKQLPPETRVFSLHAADGTPIMLGDSRASIMSNALENNLSPVSVH